MAVLSRGVEQLLISEIFTTLARFRPLRETLADLTAAIREKLQVHYCAILLERAQMLLIEGSAGLSASYVEAINHNFPVYLQELEFNESPSSQAFRSGKIVIVEDTETDPEFVRWRALARQEHYRSLIVLPLSCHGRHIGTLNCYQLEPRHYTQVEIDALMLAATQVGIAIEIARLMEAQQLTIGRLEETTYELHEQRRLLERSAEIHTTLTQLVLTNQGIPAITAALARVVQSSVVVQDQFGHVLAQSGDAWSSGELAALSREALAARAAKLTDKDARAPFELPAMPRLGLEQARAVAPIIAGQHLLGYVSLLLPDLPAPPLHLRALGHGATVLALELVKDRLAHEVELRVRHGFADDLIAGRYDDADQMRDRGRYLGHDLRGPFQVLVFDIDQFGHYVGQQRLSEADIDALRRRFFDALQSIVRSSSPHALVAGRHDQLALILTSVGDTTGEIPVAGVVTGANTALRSAERVVAAARARCAQMLPDLTISVGVGKVYPSLDQIRTSHAEAERSLRVIRRLGGCDKTLIYSDLGVMRLLFQVENASELLDFAMGRLRPVLVYDETHDGILLAALEAYLTANQSIHDAALALVLHPNTLRYRLRKIEDLLATRLDDITHLLDLQLACMILRLL